MAKRILDILTRSPEEERISYQHQRKMIGRVKTHKSQVKQGTNKR